MLPQILSLLFYLFTCHVVHINTTEVTERLECDATGIYISKPPYIIAYG